MYIYIYDYNIYIYTRILYIEWFDSHDYDWAGAWFLLTPHISLSLVLPLSLRQVFNPLNAWELHIPRLLASSSQTDAVNSCIVMSTKSTEPKYSRPFRKMAKLSEEGWVWFRPTIIPPECLSWWRPALLRNAICLGATHWFPVIVTIPTGAFVCPRSRNLGIGLGFHGSTAPSNTYHTPRLGL